MIIAIDTGGTKTLVASFSRDGVKNILGRFATPQDQNEYVASLKQLLTTSEIDLLQVNAVAIAMPGTIEHGTVARMTNLPWQNFDIAKELLPLFSNIPILVQNDAHLGGLGEVRPMAEAPEACLYLTISTGINGGMIRNGQIDESFNASELGHMYLEYDGQVRTWEEFASGKMIVENYGKLASEIEDPSLWREISRRMSRGFMALLPVMRPDLIIIGGGVGTHFNKYSTHLESHIAESVPEYYRCPIIRAAHPEEAVLYGCYYYAVDALATKAA